MATHEHRYVFLNRPGWPGVNCTVCGLYVPPTLLHVRAVRERIVAEEGN